MFEVGFAELFLLGVIALLVVGPDKLPGLARTVGVWVGKAQRLVGQVRADIEREVRADELRKAAKEYSPTNVLSDMRKEVEDFAGEVSKPVEVDAKPDESGGTTDTGEGEPTKSAATASPAGEPESPPTVAAEGEGAGGDSRVGRSCRGHRDEDRAGSGRSGIRVGRRERSGCEGRRHAECRAGGSGGGDSPGGRCARRFPRGASRTGPAPGGGSI